MVGIYKITNPKGKIYIGQSIKILNRIGYYKAGHCKGQAKLYQSIKKYGWDAHKFEVIHRCSREELNDLEEYYISLYNTFNTKFGLNLQSGGKVVKDSDETKKKRSLSLKGRVFTQEWKDKIGAKSKGRIPWNKGKTNCYSEETIEKMRGQRYHVPYNKGKGFSKQVRMARHAKQNREWRLRVKQKKIQLNAKQNKKQTSLFASFT